MKQRKAEKLRKDVLDRSVSDLQGTSHSAGSEDIFINYLNVSTDTRIYWLLTLCASPNSILYSFNDKRTVEGLTED